MTCYNEEAGTYTFPAGEYTRLKREFKAFWDKQMQDLYDGSVRFYEYAQKAGKDASIHKLYDDRRLHESLAEMIQYQCQILKKGKNGRWMKPKKMDMANYKANTIFKKGGHFEMGEAGLSFDDERREVTWRVDNNNHAVDDARKTPMAGFFFGFLRTVKWRGRTGGQVAYMDEYMSENGPCEPSYNHMYGYAVKDFEARMDFMFKQTRKPRRR